MEDLFGYSVSEGSLQNFSGYADESLEDFKALFFDHVNLFKFANVDETTTRVNGKRGHLHVFSNVNHQKSTYPLDLFTLQS